MAVSDLEQNEFEAKVLKSKVPVIIDFWAEWCGPCRIFSPIIDEVSKEYTEEKAAFFKVNVDENQEISEKFGIMSIPTCLIFENGTIKAQIVGAVPKESFRKWLGQNI